MGPALIAVVAFTLLIGGMARSSGEAHAATGDNLRQITGAVPAGTGTGIAFDGTHLIYTVWGHNTLWRVSPADGSLVDSINIAGVSNLGAIAWDGDRGKLWACDNGSTVVLINVGAATSAPAFSSNGCLDGLAYDGTDDTIWASCDACNDLYHYSTTGSVLGHFTGMVAKLGGDGNSGIAVGGDKIYLANDGGSTVYGCTKDLVTCNVLSTFAQHRLEDLECDNVTFAPKGAMWSIDAYDRIANAWEIPAGTCSYGGGVGSQPTAPVIVHSATPTFTATPKATQTPLPSTPTAVPSNTVVPPQTTATPPGGGAAGVITGPNTGSGPGAAEMRLGWMLLAVASLSGGALLSMAALRARRR